MRACSRIIKTERNISFPAYCNRDRRCQQNQGCHNAILQWNCIANQFVLFAYVGPGFHPLFLFVSQTLGLSFELSTVRRSVLSNRWLNKIYINWHYSRHTYQIIFSKISWTVLPRAWFITIVTVNSTWTHTWKKQNTTLEIVIRTYDNELSVVGRNIII